MVLSGIDYFIGNMSLKRHYFAVNLASAPKGSKKYSSSRLCYFVYNHIALECVKDLQLNIS